MEYLCRNIEINNNTSIIGERDQTLQVILKKNDSIVLKKQNLQYMSSEALEETLFSKKKSTNEEKIVKLGKRINDNNLVKLKNINSNFEYIGLFQGG
jgi:hypothetical protein